MSITVAKSARRVSFFDVFSRTATNLHSTRRCLVPMSHIRCQSVHAPTPARSLIFRQYGEPTDVLSLLTHSIPPARGAMLTLRMLAAPIHPADLNMIQGSYPIKPRFSTALSTAEPVAVPGKEGVAAVIDVGEDAAICGWKKGDWAILRASNVGMWRTHVQAPASKFLRISSDDGVPALQVANVGINPCTAWAMLKGWIGDGRKRVDVDERLHQGDFFAQNGANSGVGRAGIQLGKAWGLKSVNIIRERPGGAAKTEALKRELYDLGADWVFTAAEAEDKGFAERIQEEVLGVRRKVGIKLGLNCVGGKSALALANVLDEGAWHLTYGAMAKEPVAVPARLSIFKHQRFAGFFRSRWSEMQPEEYKEAVQEVLTMMKAGTFRGAPTQEAQWSWDTNEEALKSAIAGTLGGFRAKKGMFVFGQ